MTVTLGSNIASLTAQRRLAEGTSSLSKTFERLSSGQRINRSSDDAAGLAIAARLNVDTRVYTQAVRNVNDGLSALAIAQGSLGELVSITVRQLELTEQSANGTYSLAQRRAMNLELNALVDEYNRIIEGTSFNGQNLIDRSLSDLRIQAGYGLDGSISFAIGNGLARTTGDGTFTTTLSLETDPSSNGVTSVAAVDLNRDGNTDLIAGTSGNGLYVYLGNGDKTFAAGVNYTTTSSPLTIISADIDSDGVLDLVTADSFYTGDILLGNGDGTFQASSTFGQSSFSESVAVADLNRDGLLDLVTAGGSGVNVLIGNGDGTFQADRQVLSDFSARSVDIADLNGDSLFDLVTSDNGGFVHVSLGNGDGTFQDSISYAVAGVDRSVVLADFNADEVLDIAASAGATVKILMGNGNGTFQASLSIDAGGFSISSVIAGEIDGDGRIDLVVAGGGTAAAFIGKGDGTFLARATFQAGGGDGIAAADLDRDGVLDLVAADAIVTTFNVLFGNDRSVTTTPHLNINTQEGAFATMAILNETLQRIETELGGIGATQSRLGVALNILAVSRENFSAAAGRITDADVAQESAKLVRGQILQQAAASVLAQANQQPALALQLIGGG